MVEDSESCDEVDCDTCDVAAWLEATEAWDEVNWDEVD